MREKSWVTSNDKGIYRPQYDIYTITDQLLQTIIMLNTMIKCYKTFENKKLCDQHVIVNTDSFIWIKLISFVSIHRILCILNTHE